MKKSINKSSIFRDEKQLIALKPNTHQYYAKDLAINNLYVAIRDRKREYNDVAKTFVYRYSFKNKIYQISIGAYPEVTLDQAREKSGEYNAILNDEENRMMGIHPKVYLQREKAERKRLAELNKPRTFEEITLEWLSIQDRSFLTDKTKMGRIKRHLFPLLGNRLVKTLGKRDFIECIELIQAKGKIETSRRVFSLAREIMQFALNRDYIERNVLRDIEFSKTFRTVEVQHHRTITDPTKLKDLLLVIEEYPALITRYALKASALLFLRSGNIRGMKWEYVDTNKRLITFPAKDMKMKSDFVVPISNQMLEVLESVKPLSCTSVYVFPSDISKTKQMSENTLNYAIKRMGFGEEMVFHGFRATASTLLHENTPNHKIASEVIELCLDHKDRNKVKASYNHSVRLQERRELMQWWSDCLDEVREGKIE